MKRVGEVRMREGLGLFRGIWSMQIALEKVEDNG